MTTFLSWLVLAVPQSLAAPGTDAAPDAASPDAAQQQALEQLAEDLEKEADDVEADAQEGTEAPAPPVELDAEQRDEAVELPPAEPEVVSNADLEAVEPPRDGIWEWVDKLEGEVPTEEQLAALKESEAERRSELLEVLAQTDMPDTMYADPKGALYVDPLFLDQVDPNDFDIPIEVNGSVAKWVDYFTGRGRKYYERWLRRSSRYRPMMYEKLEAAGLPRDLVYLSMIESGYNAHAYSHAHAAGLWQFIPSTARLYKLRVDYWVDDRRDPAHSTDAAIRFLGELHQIFDGDWRLAWASYNTGPGRVRRAIRRSGTTDFWKIQAGPYLASETDNYVPKIMAAAIIGHYPERYGFKDIAFEEQLAYDEVEIKEAVEVRILAKAAGMSEAEFRYLNPALRRFATPSDGYKIRVRQGKAEPFKVAFAKIPKHERLTILKHKVAKGETLSRIAARYGVSVNAITTANRMRNANRIYVGMELIIPRGGASAAMVASNAGGSSSSSRSSSSRSTVSVHTVRRGDTLSAIAARYGTSVSNIRALNNLSGTTIQAGQKLKVRGTASATSRSRATGTHVVASGETLSRIAARYGTSTANLQKMNNLASASKIYAGQRLKVPGGQASASSWSTYTVRSGDNLGRIAQSRGVTVDQIRSWNNLRGTTIHPGQKLKIRK